VSLCKRRGFIFQSSEIYGGVNGFWGYGPLGVALKQNLRDAWWDAMVHHPPAGPDAKPVEIVGLDCSIISHPKVWEASGHTAGFADPMQTCRICKKLYRADHVGELLDESEWVQALLATCEAGAVPGTYVPRRAELKRWAETKGKKAARGLAVVREPALIAGLAENEHDVASL